jgi:hypothetical protein
MNCPLIVPRLHEVENFDSVWIMVYCDLKLYIEALCRNCLFDNYVVLRLLESVFVTSGGKTLCMSCV